MPIRRAIRGRIIDRPRVQTNQIHLLRPTDEYHLRAGVGRYPGQGQQLSVSRTLRNVFQHGSLPILSGKRFYGDQGYRPAAVTRQQTISQCFRGALKNKPVLHPRRHTAERT